MTRAVSLVGWTRSPISALTESSDVFPRAADGAERGALVDLALLADDPADPLQLVGHPLVELDHLVEGVGDLAGDARPVERQANREIAFAKRRERRQKRLGINTLCRWFLESRHEVASGIAKMPKICWLPGSREYL